MFGGADAIERRRVDVTNARVPGGPHDRLAGWLIDVETPSRQCRGAETDLRKPQRGAADLTGIPCGHFHLLRHVMSRGVTGPKPEGNWRGRGQFECRTGVALRRSGCTPESV